MQPVWIEMPFNSDRKLSKIHYLPLPDAAGVTTKQDITSPLTGSLGDKVRYFTPSKVNMHMRFPFCRNIIQ